MDTGIVHEDVEASKTIDHLVDEGRDSAFVSDVGLDEVTVGAEFFDLLHGWCARLLLVILASTGILLDVDDDDTGTFAGEGEADAPADA